ncbi:MAG: DUF1573 domain-containing protein [Flavobacteriaceae bacterium]|jgi:hypothetical protein|nr:DUF1573 domain-containing protein [Flavobacteriaceae bacterium]
MRKILTAIVLVSSIVLTSCKNNDATSKINADNVETAKKRDVKINSGAAEVTFDKSQHDFGTVVEGTIVETTFKVTNSGKTDLIITDAQVTCGCTVPVWPKAPIKPGQTEDVKVKFNTNGKLNRQSKNITLITNTKSGREILTLKGMVTPKSR